MTLLTGLLAQADPGTSLPAPVITPGVDWWGVMPLLLLAAPAMVLLHVSSLLKRVFTGFYTVATIVIATVAGAFAVGLWWRVTDDAPGRGPFSTLGGAFGVDAFSVFLTVLLCLSVIFAALLADSYLRREDMEGAELYVLMLLSAAGGVVMASANDLIVMFLGLEVLSIAVYILAAAHLRKITSQEAGMKYFVLGAFSSAFFLYGIALVYGATGSTNLLEIQATLATSPFFDNDVLLLGGLGFLLVGFAFKVAAVPFHSWTPDVYQGAPSPIVAYMASGVKAAGFAGLMRVFVLAFDSQRWDWQPIMAVLAAATLFGGSVLAVVQTDVKRMMAYSSISHAGFILLGVLSASSAGTSAALFYLASYTFMIAGTFGVIAVVARRGERQTSLEDYRGLAARKPLLAYGFTVLLFAQTGVPLTSGFFAKFGVIAAVVEAEYYWIAIVAMLSAVVSAFVYLRLVVTMFGGADHDAAEGHDVAGETESAAAAGRRMRIPATTGVAIGLAVAVTIIVGCLPGLVTRLSDDAVPALVAAAR